MNCFVIILNVHFTTTMNNQKDNNIKQKQQQKVRNQWEKMKFIVCSHQLHKPMENHVNDRI